MSKVNLANPITGHANELAAEHLGVQISTDVLRLWNADHRKQRGRTAPNTSEVK